jgi:hypothetical protein
MGKRYINQLSRRRRRWPWTALGALALITLGAAAFSGRPQSRDASSATPRLVVDRTDVDLGYLRFGVRARTTFTLSNAGDGVLRLKEVPRVIAKAGC